ncbi:gamma-glutamyltransferase [Novosphingobium sp.]|uniref:gamma-glutamyltransferase n=1 Tax=Novosphingobium sp. TaxID=1874826 RepID=UPI00286A1BAA|nr:gamma-glutamyltransferase [Novosphingobium sp.]
MRAIKALIGLVSSLALTGAQIVTAAAPPPPGAENGMVVSAHRLATDAGVAVLKQGGNAVDAAIAVAYVLAVTFPEAGNIGGGGFMTIRLANGRSTFIDFRETAPAAATAMMYQDKAGNVVPLLSTRGHLSVGVPGTVAGLELARTKYGTRPRAPLMATAIALASKGFVLDQGDADFLAEGATDFAQDPASAAVFLNRGKPWRAGQRWVQADLGRTLQAVSARGNDGFYKGPVAASLAAASQAGGGIITAADLAGYKAVERKPIECDYRGFHIISAPPPSSGGVVLCETLNVLEGYPLGALGFHSAQGVHFTTEALRRSYRDRNLNLGDPDFVKFDTSRFTSKAYAAELRAGISADKATPSASLTGPGAAHEGKSTTHFSVVDKAGNAVSLTYTLNDWFGARVTAGGTGVLLNDEMDDFSAKPGFPNMYGLVEGTNNAIAPGKRPLSSMAPTIVTHDGALSMVIGTPGGSHIPTGVLQVMLNVIDHGMTLTEAVNAPRIHAQWLPDVIYYEKDALSADTMAVLMAKGHRLEQMDYWNQVAAILVGGPSLAMKPNAATGNRWRYFGAIDPRLPVGSVGGY